MDIGIGVCRFCYSWHQFDIILISFIPNRCNFYNYTSMFIPIAFEYLKLYFVAYLNLFVLSPLIRTFGQYANFNLSGIYWTFGPIGG